MVEVNNLDVKSRAIQAPTEKAGEYKSLIAGQTICTVKDEKGQNCSGHVKQWLTASADLVAKAAPGNTLHRCQRCFTIYEGPPQEYLHPQTVK